MALNVEFFRRKSYQNTTESFFAFSFSERSEGLKISIRIIGLPSDFSRTSVVSGFWRVIQRRVCSWKRSEDLEPVTSNFLQIYRELQFLQVAEKYLKVEFDLGRRSKSSESFKRKGRTHLTFFRSASVLSGFWEGLQRRVWSWKLFRAIWAFKYPGQIHQTFVRFLKCFYGFRLLRSASR